MKPLHLIRRAGAAVRDRWLQARIDIKWRRDTNHLPLTPAHKELYDIVHRSYFEELGSFPDLVNCPDFNDRIQWLKLFAQSGEMVRCSDKVLVRDYIRERVGDKYLVDLFQVHDHFGDIDFDALPDAFVIKTNHDSGTVILVRDKAELDRSRAEARIEGALSQRYGWEKGEWAYAFVEPKVLVEQFIRPDNPKPPADYKFYCVDGVVKFCHYIYDRGFDTKEQTVDPHGKDLATPLYPTFRLGTDFTKPARWDEMIDVAERLAAGFKCVRVDLYCSEDRVYAGELTFWPMAGHYKGEGQKRIGKLLDFDRTTYQPCVVPGLQRSHGCFSGAVDAPHPSGSASTAQVASRSTGNG